MKKIFGLVLLIVSFNVFGQNPTNYQYRTVRERLIAFMIDSTFHLPRYNGTPSGIRTGASTHAGAMAVDTTNERVYFWSDYVWHRLAKYSELATASRFGVEDIVAGQNRNFSGLNNTYGLTLDSLNNFLVKRNNISRIYMNSTESGITSGTGLNGFEANATEVQLSFNAGENLVYVKADSTWAKKKLSYPGNIHGTFFPYSLVDKSYVDSVAAAGSGTVNSGTTGKPAYYVGATTLDDFAAVDYATSGTNVKITTQNTTDVGLEVKAVSSQSANLFEVNSSAGSGGDLFRVNNLGRIRVDNGAEGIGTNAIEFNGSDIGLTGNSTYLMFFNNNTGSTVAIGQSGVFLRDANHAIYFGNGSLFANSNRGYIYAPAANTITIGAETPASMTFKTNNNSGSDAAGFNLTVQPGAGTGNSPTNGDIIFQTPDAAGSGSTVQSFTTKFLFDRTGFFEMKEISAPGSATSGYARVYPKSDGLWYGTDDAGTETKLSNDAGVVSISSLTAAAGTNTINNADYTQEWQWDALTAKGLTISSTHTGATSFTQKLFNIEMDGAHAASGVISRAATISNGHSGTSSTNYGIDVAATAGTTNYGLNATAGNGTDNYAIQASVSTSSATNYGIYTDVTGTSSTNYGGRFKAYNGTNNYAIVTEGGNVGFGTANPSAAALLEIASTTQGLLLPRMTKTQRDAISSPVAGLMVYQTDNTPGLRVYNGTNWMRFTETAD